MSKKHAKILFGTSYNPHFNLAVEETLLDEVRDGEILLYLWQNEHTVVIGRNQNAHTECHLAALERDGGTLARRQSGGGAVYHDLGNLNFTFVAPKSVYDLARQQGVILEMAKKLGLDAEISGRNDLTISGRKFSGNAFLYRQHASMHHGTVLVHTAAEKIAKYLNPPQIKLAGKGLPSVRSRVVNLVEISPQITVEMVKHAFCESFTEVYADFCQDHGPEMLAISQLPQEKIAVLTARNGGREYNLGDNVQYAASFTAAFPWGVADVRAEITDGVIMKIRIYTDSLDPEMVLRLEGELMGLSLSATPWPGGPAGDILARFSFGE